MDWSNLRAQWALKHTPSKEWVAMQKEIDQRANPHNDSYPNKRPRRSEAQIISDLCYEFADEVLSRQYGPDYRNWLRANCERSPWTQVNHQENA